MQLHVALGHQETAWDSFPYWTGEIAHCPCFSGLPIYLKYLFFLTNYTWYSRYDWGWVFQTHEQLPSVIQEAACAQFMWRLCTNPSPSPNSEETPYKALTHNEWLGWLWHKEDCYSDIFLCKTVCQNHYLNGLELLASFLHYLSVMEFWDYVIITNIQSSWFGRNWSLQ